MGSVFPRYKWTSVQGLVVFIVAWLHLFLNFFLQILNRYHFLLLFCSFPFCGCVGGAGEMLVGVMKSHILISFYFYLCRQFQLLWVWAPPNYMMLILLLFHAKQKKLLEELPSLLMLMVFHFTYESWSFRAGIACLWNNAL